jgi:amino acid adenylation domain-containing protein
VRSPFLLHHYLERSAEANPDGIAVVDAANSISYGLLQQRAGRVASQLKQLGVRRGDRVGIYMTKSIEAVAAIYGVLLAGAVYVPLDPSSPPRRAGYIAANCGVRHLLTASEKKTSWEEVIASGAPIEHLLVMDDQSATGEVSGAEIHSAAEVDEASDEPGESGAIEDDLAFILYTSGSTGDPKGVMLSHANCRWFVQWAVEEFGVTADDRVSSHAPFHFDLSTFDLFGASSAGAPLFLVPNKLSVFPVEVIRFIERHSISVWYSVPSILTSMAERGGLSTGALASLRTILFAGEVFPTKYLSRLMRLLPHVEFANLYGPTETNVCTWYRVPGAPGESDPPISIGRAIDNVETFVIGEDGAEVPPGDRGELFVRGPTVMKGYWDDGAKTAERLGPSPLDRHLGDPVYRTGDLVEEMGDGNYRFLGRRDNQVKSRGYRIELGEIESAVGQHPAVVECCVVAVPDEMISNRIVCFVSIKAEVSADELTRFCIERIPRYMVPERFAIVESMPKTSTGKIDRQSLLERSVSEVS